MTVPTGEGDDEPGVTDQPYEFAYNETRYRAFMGGEVEKMIGRTWQSVPYEEGVEIMKQAMAEQDEAEARAAE